MKFLCELSLQELLQKCPDIKRCIPECIDINDTNYIARIGNDGSIEIGYSEDDWRISPLS